MSNLKCLNESFLSVTQYAKKQGVSTQRIRKLISDGRLSCGKIGKQWVIPANETIINRKNGG